MQRPRFMLILLWAGAICLRVFCSEAAGPKAASAASGANCQLPNILWITAEDHGPHLGCYGDPFADTPNLDRLASRGLIYLNCWSNGPVCAPARTAIISGLYPPSTGSQHMRSMVPMPACMEMYPQFLRETGYYCTNNAKEDYNLEKPGKVWDESSRRAHWKNRRPGQPFFAVFNYHQTHESGIRRRPHSFVHDPLKVRVPAFHPDLLAVRQDWAQYYDKLSEVDAEVGRRLKELEEAGLADETIIFYYADHGPGMPRCKRWPYDSGLHVPLVAYIPEKFKHLRPREYKPGGKTGRLVSFVDLAPTLLSLVGIKPPDYMQGKAFMGHYEEPPREYIFGFRGRMDERYDMVRSVRDKRFVYTRNYMPHKIYGQYLWYMFITPTTRVWKQLYDEGKLKPPQSYFWERKPPEELYDLQNDPDEVHNLATDPKYRSTLERLRAVQRNWCLRIRDLGFLPEDEIYTRSHGTTPYQMGHDPQKYPLERIMATAELAASLRENVTLQLVNALSDRDSAVRYWAALGLLMRGRAAVAPNLAPLRELLADPAPAVMIVAAEAIGKYGSAEDLKRAAELLVKLADIERNQFFVAIQALNALDELDTKIGPQLAERVRKLPLKNPKVPGRNSSYVPRLVEKILSDLQG